MKVKVASFNTQTDAQIFSGLLHSHGIENQIVGSKNYSTYVVGGTGGEYDILVDEKDLTAAQTLLTESEKTVPELVHADEIKSHASRHLKRAVMFAIIGMIILPIIFNYYSLVNWKKFYNEEQMAFKKYFWTLIILILNAAALVLVGTIVSGLL